LAADSAGTATLEMSLIAFLLFLTTFSIAEFGYAWWQWNAADKATQLGVRLAVVSDPIAIELATFDCENSSTLPGTACSTAGASSFGTVSCNGSTHSCNGGYTFSNTEFGRLVARIQSIYPAATDANVTIDYTDIGLGFAGRGRPVPLVSVRLVNMTFSFIALDFLMGGPITMSDFRASLTAEDLRTAGVTS
jgi:hypothetical protein